MSGDNEGKHASRTTKSISNNKFVPRGALNNAGWNVFFTLWSIGVSFLLTPLMIHYLGVEHYGILLLLWSITGILGIVNFGFGEATLRYVAHYYVGGDLSGVNRVFGATLSFNVVMCGIVLVGLFFSAPAVVTWLKIPHGDYDLVTWLLRLAGVVFSFGLIFRTFSAIPMALMRYDISSKINIGQSIVRSVGYVLLMITKFGIFYLLLWDAVISLVALCVQLVVAHKILPGLKRMPSFRFNGLREIMGYSIFSFLIFGFLMLHREAGKLALGRLIGPSAVAFLATPDNVAQRGHALVVSGSETLLPRFSTNKDLKSIRELFMNSIWAGLFASIVLLVPLTVLMKDFLSLWISPEFARESTLVGQLVALSYITQGALAPASSYFRGSGKPWFVMVVVLFAGVSTVLFCILLIPTHGVLGAGYAYLIGSITHFIGLLIAWFCVLGKFSVLSLIRIVIMPLILAIISFFIEIEIRSLFVDVGWFEFFTLGGLFVAITALPILGFDIIVGGHSPAGKFYAQTVNSKLVKSLLRFTQDRKCC